MYKPSGPVENGSLAEIIKKYNSLEDKSLENIKKVFKTIKGYDVNSLYPSRMKANKFPTDVILKFIGDISNNSDYKHLYDENLGIFKVIVEAPEIDNPLLPFKVRGSTIFGHGKWKGWYLSEEIKNAEKYGYTFEILGGYIFESADLFSKYVEALNSIKESSPKSSAMYLISKILMNSLYGRMGMCPFLGQSKFYVKKDLAALLDKKAIKIEDIEDEVDYGAHTLLTTNKHNENNWGLDGNVSVAIAITAYSRILMSEVKNIPGVKLYYTDTDSIFTNIYLDDHFVDSKQIGLWKLEDEYLYGVFLGPKTYGCMNTSLKSYSKIKGYNFSVPLVELDKLKNANNKGKFELILDKGLRKLLNKKLKQ